MQPTAFESRLRAGVGGKELWDLRKETAMVTGASFVGIGLAMSSRHDLPGQDGEAVRAMGSLLQMAGELAFAAGRMLSDGEHYAGAALVRQIVEIEYLTWTFKEGHASVNAWLNSTFDERMKVFSPKRLRRNAKGRFLSKDYQNHCEEGGHPVPRGIPLLGGKELGGAQILLVDLLTHCWRTWDQVHKWLTKLPIANEISLPAVGMELSWRLDAWGKQDPIYALSVELHPNREAEP